jgi:uncharacterized membrane protein YphA (DoxX/SURF4 family)
MNILLWILQGLLGLLFLFAGISKFVIPYAKMIEMGPPNQIIFPAWFIYFIGVCETLGGLGLILPGIFRTRRGLTPLAALGLFIIMVGATVVTIIPMGVGAGIGNLVIALLLAFVAYGRWRLAPLR